MLNKHTNMSTKRKAADLPLTPSKRQHKVLTLCEKVEVIEAVIAGLNFVQAATKFGCGRTQIANIMNNKKNILDAYTNGTKATTKYLQLHNCQYPQINEKV